MGGIVSKPKAPTPPPAPVAKPVESTAEERQRAARIRARSMGRPVLLSGQGAARAFVDPLSLKDTLGQG